MARNRNPLQRALETAEILANRPRLPLETPEAQRELDCGVIEGRSDPASGECYSALWLG
jgi:broad specificity phosphatase PhoE